MLQKSRIEATRKCRSGNNEVNSVDSQTRRKEKETKKKLFKSFIIETFAMDLYCARFETLS